LLGGNLTMVGLVAMLQPLPGWSQSQAWTAYGTSRVVASGVAPGGGEPAGVVPVGILIAGVVQADVVQADVVQADVVQADVVARAAQRAPWNQQDRYTSVKGRIDFVSDAPLESIKAWSDDMRGVLDRSGNFAFSVSMASFEGFNSGLQREHFRENYLEISRYPKAAFEGHLIEQPNLNSPGTYPVRVRGQLTIHGVTRERILPGTLRVLPDKSLEISAEFDVPLGEHNITIPKIMHQKIAESIRVTVQARLTATP
jgi:polyisoprenoid-binding protein YceI